MDKLSIFGGKEKTEVKITSEGNNSLDTLVENQEDILKELKLTRKGHEASTWGEEVADMEDVDLEEVENEH